MNDYVILTDSSADLSDKMVKELELSVLPLRFIMQDNTYQNFPDNREMDPKLFYKNLREGATCTTSAVNVADYNEALEPILQSGKDVLVLAFSSGLSATCQSAMLSAEEMGEKFPQRKVYAVDTLCASLGQGLIVWYAAQMKKAGKSIDEVRNWVEENKLNLCHWVTVDDLHFLKRGGRISATTAVMGSLLQIKPLIHVDNEGKLVNVGKARGRAAALTTLVDEMEKRAINPKDQVVFISHGDCEEDAKKVAEDLKKRLGVKQVVLNTIGPVIGAHAGPGTVALFYLGNER